MIKFTVILLIIMLNFQRIDMMTEAQMKSTAKLMRNVCQPKNKASNEQIDNMHVGQWDDAKETQCYMFCCLQMMKVVNKQGVFDYDFSVKQVKTLPKRYQNSSYKTMEACKDSQTESDSCAKAYQLAKCIYFADPEYYFLP